METWQLKYVKFQDRINYWTGRRTRTRIVNQDEIREYFIHNPGKTENQMQVDLYGYDRNTSMDSNKKYADCLRRALGSGKISRVKVKTPKGPRYVYFVPSI